ncbi:MAG: pirin family protein [Pseudomonadota bacterium]
MSGPIKLLIEPRQHDLGGFSVRRVLPYAKQRMVGPFIFFDHMGPGEFPPGKGVDVRPHPHIGLATVTYLFAGALGHKDTTGADIVIRPGAVNWMTAGRGVAHSERTPPDERAAGHKIHGIQTWVALPKSHEEAEPGFVHHPADTLPEFDLGGARARLIAGDAWGHRSPVEFPWGIWYLAVEAEADAAYDIPADAADERALYVVEGAVALDGQTVGERTMAVLEGGGSVSVSMSAGAKVMLAGGEAMDGARHINWNFVSSSKDRINQAREDWRASIAADWKNSPFAQVPGETEWIPLPEDR